MEKLNEYLQKLLSTCSYELHLEPNRNPYLVTSNGATDIAVSPLLGTQISMMVFPLIPSNVKQQLPNESEIEFTHPHNLGNFNFVVKKSPSGFNVTIRPLFTEKKMTDDNAAPIIESNVPFLTSPLPPSPPPPSVPMPDFSFESASAAQEKNQSFASNYSAVAELEIEEPITNSYYESSPSIEVVPVNDPQFTTTFSDNSTYEPPGKRDDLMFGGSEYTPPPAAAAKFSVEYDESPISDGGYEYQPENSSPDQLYSPQNYQHAAPAANYQSPNGFGDQTFNQPPTPAAYQAENFHAPAAIQNAPPAPAAAPADSALTKKRMDALFYRMADVGASDLHLSVSMPPMIRKDGKMQRLECSEPELTPDLMKELLTSIMPARNREEFAERSDTDFAYEIEGLARFRANVFADRKGMGGVFRIIPSKILTAQQLGLSQAILNLCDLSKGLVVVTGPTGSGKSTTLCAMVDHINKQREDHIITIEDPIEFTHENQKCLVNQREVHNHTNSFKDALRAALREDPDILLVGEMRDLETISIAIETAETGHLVFGTLHTTTAASTIDRIIDQFPADRQQQIRVMLSESLKGVIAQTLLPKKGGGRVAALEVLIVTPAISNLIREGKTFQIPSAMQTGKQLGMVMLNDALMNLVQLGLVEPRDAYIKAVDKPNFESLLTRNGFRL